MMSSFTYLTAGTEADRIQAFETLKQAFVTSGHYHRSVIFTLDQSTKDAYAANSLLIAKDGETVIGAAVLTVGKSGLELEWIGVDPSYQRSGIGVDLLTASIDHARSRYTKLIVKTRDQGLVSFYTKGGAVYQGRTDLGLYEFHAE